MIRINLLRNLEATGGQAETAVADGLVFDQVSEVNKLQVIIKLAFILALPYLVHIYGENILQERTTELGGLDQQLAALNKEAEEFKSEIEMVNRHVEEKKRLERQIEVIGVLSRGRFSGLLAVDTLQSLMPQTAWLSKVSYVNGVFSISGYAYDQQDVTSLIRGMEESVFFSEVKFIGSVDKKTSRGTLKSFDISCKVESI